MYISCGTNLNYLYVGNMRRMAVISVSDQFHHDSWNSVLSISCVDANRKYTKKKSVGRMFLSQCAICVQQWNSLLYVYGINIRKSLCFCSCAKWDGSTNWNTICNLCNIIYKVSIFTINTELLQIKYFVSAQVSCFIDSQEFKKLASFFVTVFLEFY